MCARQAGSAKSKLIEAAIELIRRNGFVATTVDDICAAAGVSKGAFFHHFNGKEDLAEACLREWDAFVVAMESSAPFVALEDSAQQLEGCMDFYIGLFERPDVLKSCLAGTTVQEVSQSNPRLREAAHRCFVSGRQRMAARVEAAARAAGRDVDAASLSDLWSAALQGALLLYKASGDATVFRRTLSLVRDFIVAQAAGGHASPHSRT